MPLTGRVLNPDLVSLDLFPRGQDRNPPVFAASSAGFFGRLWTVFSNGWVSSSIQTGAAIIPVLFDIQELAKTLGIASDTIPRKTPDFERFLEGQALSRNIQQLQNAVPDLNDQELGIIKWWVQHPNIEPVIPENSIIKRLRLSPEGRPTLEMFQWGVYPLSPTREWDLSQSSFSDGSLAFGGGSFFFSLPNWVPVPKWNLFELSSRDIVKIRDVVHHNYLSVRQTKKRYSLQIPSQLPCYVNIDRSGEIFLTWESYHALEKTVRIFNTTLECLSRKCDRREILPSQPPQKKFAHFLKHGRNILWANFQMFMAPFKMDGKKVESIFQWIEQNYYKKWEQISELEGVKIRIDAEGGVFLQILNPPLKPRSLAALAAESIPFFSLPRIFLALLREGGVDPVKAEKISSRLHENYQGWRATAQATNGWYRESGLMVKPDGNIYIKQKPGPYSREGTFKKPKEAIDLFSGIRRMRLVVDPTEPGIINEINVLQRCKGCRGLVQFVDALSYVNRKGENLVAIFEKKYRLGELKAYLESGIAYFTPGQQKELINDLIYGLATFHEKGYVHCDLSSNNLYFDTLDDEEVLDVVLTPFSSLKGAIGDFNMVQQVQDGGRIELCGNYAASSPQKATLWLAADQMKDRSKAYRTGKEALQDDIWALGLALHAIRGNSLPWAHIQGEKSRLPSLAAFDRKEYPKEVMESFYPAPEEKDSIDFLIYRMLQLDPEKRPMMSEVVATIEKIWGSV